MTDLSGIAHQLHRSVEALRIAAGLLEQGYQPAFIAQYRADESGNLSRAELWALKLEIDRQQRLATSRVRLTSQLPKDAVLDEEAEKSVSESKTELDVEVALRAFRSRRALSNAEESADRSGEVLEALISCQDSVSDPQLYVAEKLGVDATEAATLLESTQRLISNLLSGDTELARKLRDSIQRKAKISVELCPPPTSEEAIPNSPENASSAEGQPVKDPKTVETLTNDAAQSDATSAQQPPPESVSTAPNVAETNVIATEISVKEPGATDSEQSSDNDAAAVAETVTVVAAEASSTEAAAGTKTSENEEPTSDSQVTAESGEASSSDQDADEILSKRFSESKKEKKKSRDAKANATKSPAKMTPRQRRRRWLVAMLTPMKSLKKPLLKLTAYQQLMLGRGRRSQIVETHLQYDSNALVAQARDRFVRRDHPFAKWFSDTVSLALESGLRNKIESDAVAELEERASEKLLTTAALGLRRTLMQRPVRGHRIMVVDSVGPKVSAVAIVDQAGNVLACEEIQCSALSAMVEQNVMRLGELAHKYKVTLLALTNGPARRFLVHTVRELVKQSANSGLRWTMADRSGADAYAAGRIALRELSAFNRRDRAAIWVARSLQDPLTQYLKVGINRIRLGSYQRELPQEPLKKLVRETIADCVAWRGVDVHSASVAQLLCVPGIHDEQAQQIATLAAQGSIESREHLIQSIEGWTETQSRQAIGLLRVFGSEQTLDATSIHPDDYRLAQRLIDNTELESPPTAPEGWSKPDPIDLSASNSHFAAEDGQAEAAADEDQEQTATATQQSESPEDNAEAQSSANLEEATEAATRPSENPEPPAVEPTAGETEQPAEATEVTTNAEETPSEASDSSESTTDAIDAIVTSEADASTGKDSPVEGQGTAAEGSETQSTESTEQADPGPAPEYPEDVVAQKEKPLPIDVEKLARGWQVGREKLKSVASALNDPFADHRLKEPPVPLRSEMPSLENLQSDTCIWAVVVGVADFGIFVELGPECSGLIHISRLSDRYVDDPHEFVQVGDLIMTWVVSVDEKKGRVALTALSPEQRAAQRDARGQRDSGDQRRHGANERRGGNRDSAGPRGTEQGRGGSSDRGGRGRGPGGGQRGDKRGGGGQQRGPGRHRGRDNRRDQRPSKPVIVKSKKPVEPISSAMKDGAEPLRSFSDLLQFYDAKRTDEPEAKTPNEQSVTEPADSELSTKADQQESPSVADGSAETVAPAESQVSDEATTSAVTAESPVVKASEEASTGEDQQNS